MNLTDFLLARIAEDEAEALGLIEDYPETVARGAVYWCANGSDVEIAMSVPRALAECQAKRRIVEDLGHSQPHDTDWLTVTTVLRLIATVYANHPDFRPEWALDSAFTNNTGS